MTQNGWTTASSLCKQHIAVLLFLRNKNVFLQSHTKDVCVFCCFCFCFLIHITSSKEEPVFLQLYLYYTFISLAQQICFYYLLSVEE